MKSTKLTLDQILALQIELEGNDQIKGIFAHKLPFKTKYYLNELLQSIKPSVEFVRSESDKLVKELGVEDNGQIIIKQDNPAFAQYWKQMEEITSVEKEITHYPFTFSDFEHCELDGYHRHIFLLIQNN
jgi:hypothetical protein